MYTDIIWHLNCTQGMLGEGHRMEVANTVLVSVLPEVWGQWLMYGAHWPLGHCVSDGVPWGRCVSDGCQWWTPWLALAISPSGGQFDSTHFGVSQNGLSDWRRHLCEGYVKVLKVHLRLTMTCDHSALNQHYSICERKQCCISTGNWTPLNCGAVSYQNVTIGL